VHTSKKLHDVNTNGKIIQKFQQLQHYVYS